MQVTKLHPQKDQNIQIFQISSVLVWKILQDMGVRLL